MKFPSLKRFVKAILRFVKRPDIAPKRVQDARYAYCRTCPWNDSMQCLACTCYIPLKIILATESCPKAYWGEYFSRRRNGLK